MGNVTAHPEIINLTRNDGWKSALMFIKFKYFTCILKVNITWKLDCLKENNFYCFFYCVKRLINDNVNNNDCAMVTSLFLYTIHIYFLSPLTFVCVRFT